MESASGKAKRGLACPVCGSAMEAVRKGLIEVDRCGEHGVWLDRGELEQIVMSGRGRESRRGRFDARSARQEGRLQGHLLGVFSFFLD